MDCASFCIMALAVALTPAPDIQRCTYCVDVRGITPTCNHNLLYCAEENPDFVVYCLTVDMVQFDGTVRRQIRCRSREAYNVTLASTKEMMSQEDCNFSNSKVCDCATCPLRPEMTTTAEPYFIRRKTTHKPRRLNLDKAKENGIWLKRLPFPVFENKSLETGAKADSIHSNEQFLDINNSGNLPSFFNCIIGLFFVFFMA